MFEVITGGKPDKERKLKENMEKKRRIYYDSYQKWLYGYDGETDRKKAVYYGVMYYSCADLNAMDLHRLMVGITDCMDIKTEMGNLTYKEMMQMFPILKSYDGEKYECKDYFSTMEYLSNFNLNKEIGDNGVDDFLWEYYNYYLMNFSIKELLMLERIRKLNHQKGIFESFLEVVGLKDKIHTYTLDKDNGIMYDNETGESFSVSINDKTRKEEKYFKVIESET